MIVVDDALYLFMQKHRLDRYFIYLAERHLFGDEGRDAGNRAAQQKMPKVK